MSEMITISDNVNVTISTTYKFMLPGNLFLSVFILLQNSIILVDYFPDRWKFVTSIFMLIAAFDMIQAFGSILKAIPAVICLLNSQANVPKWLNMCHFPIAGTSYICSVFFNVVLSATKTINIKNPFFRINRNAVHVVLLCGACIWTVAAVVGFTHALLHSPPFIKDSGRCPAQWLKLMEGTSTFITFGFATIFSIRIDQHGNPVVLRSIVEIVAFMLPCVVVFVCMVIQMYYIKKSLSTGRAELSAETNHVNVTVFLVSMLFVICTFIHSPDIAFLLARATGQDDDLDPYQSTAPALLAMYTLPLINAAVYPLIIILRKPSLKKKYRERLIRLVRYPVNIWSRFCSPGPEYEALNN